MRYFTHRLWIILLACALALPLFATMPQPAAAQGCGTAPAPRLTAGQSARVTVTNGTGNNLRATNTTNATVLGVLADGEIVSVLSGPQCVDNIYWWQVRRWNNETGWTGEGDATGYWLEPWPQTGAQLVPGTRPALPDLKIAYLSGYEGYVVPHSIAADGSGLQAWGQTPAAGNRIVWSPNGMQIAFSDGDDLWVLGQFDALQVTNTPGVIESWPTFSPDGQRLAFVRENAGSSEIMIYSFFDQSIIPVTNVAAQNTMPAWSPDGSRIAFISDRDGNTELYIVGVDGSGLARITSTPGDETTPVWSPDAQKIAYTISENNVQRLAIVTPGMTPVLLNDSSVTDVPAWSPDGSRIVYAAETTPGSGQYAVFSVRSDGQDTFQYTVSGGQVAGVTWSPGGEWIVFGSNMAGNYDLYAIRPNGIGLVRLTENPGIDSYPVFQPPTTPNLPDESSSASGSTAGSATGEQDLLLIYDAGVPVFTLQNTAGQNVNLEPLTFVGGGVTVPASIWTDYTYSPLNDFKAIGCLMLWPFGVPDQPTPDECGDARQGWISNNAYIFWTQGSFEVLYNNVSLGVCQTDLGRCTIDLP